MPSSKIQTPIVCQCPWPTVRHGRHVIQWFLESKHLSGSGCDWKLILFFKKSTSKKWSETISIRKLSTDVKPVCCKGNANLWNPSTKSWEFKDTPPNENSNNPLHYGLMSWGENGPQTDSKGNKGGLSVPTLCISSSVTAGRVSSLEDRETGLVYKVVVVASRSL